MLKLVLLKSIPCKARKKARSLGHNRLSLRAF
nr:MAG TPA: hypothetical protein [Caudoviricetes sp.]